MKRRRCVGSGIQFPSSTRCSHPFDAHDPYGIHSIWLCLFLLGLSSSEMTTLKTSHATPHVGLMLPRLSRGCIVGVDIAAVVQAKVGPSGP